MAIECRIGYRRVYGIAAVDSEDGEKIILDAIVDVTGDRDTAVMLADRCSREKLPLDQFRSFIVDSVDREG